MIFKFLSSLFGQIVYKKTDKWYIEWWVTTNDNEWQPMVQRVTMNDNEWQRVVQQVTTSGTTSDNEWQRVTTSGTTSDNEWQRVIQVKTNDNEWQRVVQQVTKWQRVIQRVTTSDNKWQWVTTCDSSGTTNGHGTAHFKEWMIVVLSMTKTYTLLLQGMDGCN